MENKDSVQKETRGYYVEKGSFFAHASVTILVLSIAAVLLGTMNVWSEGMMSLLIQVLLPVGCSLLFIVFILLLGRVALWSTILPVLGGAAFFILSVFDGDQTPGWSMFICIALSFLAAFLYTATLSGMIRTKWLIVLAFGLIFAYQIVFQAVPAFRKSDDPVSFVGGMKLLSSLGFVFAMLCATLAFRRKKSVKPEPELPKIKDPVVVKPEEEEKTDGSDVQDPASDSAAAASSEENTDINVMEPGPEMPGENLETDTQENSDTK